MTEEEFKYIAFISYKHEDLDRKWSKWILEHVEKYIVPKELISKGHNKSLGKCYRDEDEASVGVELGEAINLALGQSKYLIVICSKQTPKSKWVTKEIEQFIKHRPQENVLLVLVDGDAEEAFPKIIFEKFSDPFAAPGRPITDEPFKRTRERAIVKLIAGMLDVEFDYLWDREHRRKIRTRVLQGIVAFTVLGVLAMTVIGGQMRLLNQANEMTIESLDQRSRILINSATNSEQLKKFDDGLNWILEGENHSPKFLNRCPGSNIDSVKCREHELELLLRILPNTYPSKVMPLGVDGNGHIETSDNAKYYAVGGREYLSMGNLENYETHEIPLIEKIKGTLPGQDKVIEIDRPNQFPRKLKISEDGNYVFLLFYSGEPRVEVYNVKNGSASFSVPLNTHNQMYRNLVISENGENFLFESTPYEWTLWDTKTNSESKKFFVGPYESHAAFSANGETIAFERRIAKDEIYIWKSEFEKERKLTEYDNDTVKDVKFLSKDNLLIVLEDSVEVWSTSDFTRLQAIDLSEETLEKAYYSKLTDKIVLTTREQTIHLVSKQDDKYEIVSSVEKSFREATLDLKFDSTGRKIIVHNREVLSSETLESEFIVPIDLKFVNSVFFAPTEGFFGFKYPNYIKVIDLTADLNSTHPIEGAIETAILGEPPLIPKCIQIDDDPCSIDLSLYNEILYYVSPSGNWYAAELSPLSEGLPKYLAVWPKGSIKDIRLLLLDSEVLEIGRSVYNMHFSDDEKKLILESIPAGIWQWQDDLAGTITMGENSVSYPVPDARRIQFVGAGQFIVSQNSIGNEIKIHSYPDPKLVWSFKFNGEFIERFSLTKGNDTLKAHMYEGEHYTYSLPSFLKDALNQMLTFESKEFYRGVFNFAEESVSTCLNPKQRIEAGVSEIFPPCYCEYKRWPTATQWKESGVNFELNRPGGWSCKKEESKNVD